MEAISDHLIRGGRYVWSLCGRCIRILGSVHVVSIVGRTAVHGVRTRGSTVESLPISVVPVIWPTHRVEPDGGTFSYLKLTGRTYQDQLLESDRFNKMVEEDKMCLCYSATWNNKPVWGTLTVSDWPASVCVITCWYDWQSTCCIDELQVTDGLLYRSVRSHVIGFLRMRFVHTCYIVKRWGELQLMLMIWDEQLTFFS